MQKQVNLSIQQPEDNTSTIGMHSDIFAGESPFQLNQWLPLVDCFDSKSMYILPPEKNREVMNDFPKYEDKGMSAVFEAYKKDIKFIKISYGQVMIFNPNLFHGNIINKTKDTRFSFNTRYKSLFSPYYKVVFYP